MVINNSKILNDEHDSIHKAKKVNVVAGSIVIDPGTIQIGDVGLVDINGDSLNPSTSENQLVIIGKQDDLITAVQLDITKAINEINFDLNASAFSETTNLTGDYILDNIEFNFSTEEEKTITVKTTTGTTIWEDTNAEKSVFLSNMNIALSENIIVEVTQFTSAGTMSCIARTK